MESRTEDEEVEGDEGELTTLCLKPFMTATGANAPWAVRNYERQDASERREENQSSVVRG